MPQERVEIPEAVLAAYGFEGLDCAPLGGGLINDTFAVRRNGEAVFVLQRLHPVFSGEVNLDLDAVTTHLADKGLVTPRLVPTRTGDAWFDTDDRPWRVITYVPGRCVERVTDPAQPESAGDLVGRFHRAVADLEHQYVHVRTGVHDTARHLDKLRRLRAGNGEGDHALADEVLAAAEELPAWDDLPQRHAHGDLKLSNVLFAETDWKALCLIDLDTCGLQTIPYELGDALRSWCNPRGEDVDAPSLDLDILERAMRGYARGAEGLLSPLEIEAIVPGLETICIELAARFAADVYEDSYFGWDPQRFGSRREHNVVRARGQLALGRSVSKKRTEAMDLVRSCFAR